MKSFGLSPEDTEHGSMVEDFVSVVRGGSSETITALVSKKLPTPELMGLWGEGVRYNPDFIRKTVSSSVFPLQHAILEFDAETFTRVVHRWHRGGWYSYKHDVYK